jgi:tetratricopeptide (TPR) repeat protein
MTRPTALFALSFSFSLLSNEFSAHAARSAEHAHRLLSEWRIEEAEHEIEALVRARPHDPDVALVDGDLKFQRGDYDGAVARLREALEKHPGAGDMGDELRALRDLAQATAEVTHGFEEQRSSQGHFIVRYAPGKDALIAPYALEALESAWSALGDDFGDHPSASEPVRVEIYGDVGDLAKVSTLTLREIETSGTIALCKFNRLMIVSPRALIAGYPWLDTLNHEYTHFIVSRVSHNTVPIWLHEGLAKFEEHRWRAPGASGLTATMEHLLASGIARKHLITFEQMHPSMAKLPSQEDTALAFAEVYSVVEYLEQQVGWPGLRQIVAGLRAGKSDDAAVASVVGRDFDMFQRDWRAWLHGRKLRQRPGLIPTELKFKKGDQDAPEDASQIAEERGRKLARLGGLLRARHRLRAAAVEYEKAAALVGAGHPQVANPLARTWLELGDANRAIAAAQPMAELYPDLAAPAATLGEGYLKKGDYEKAAVHLEAALRISPFDPAIHCGLEKVFRQRGDQRAAREEAACRALGG